MFGLDECGLVLDDVLFLGFGFVFGLGELFVVFLVVLLCIGLLVLLFDLVVLFLDFVCFFKMLLFIFGGGFECWC